MICIEGFYFTESNFKRELKKKNKVTLQRIVKNTAGGSTELELMIHDFSTELLTNMAGRKKRAGVEYFGNIRFNL